MQNKYTLFIIEALLATFGLFLGFMENSMLPLLVFLFPVVLYHIVCTAVRISSLLKKVYLLSIIVASVNLYWIAFPLMEIGKIPFPFASLIVILLAGVLALFPTLFSYTLFKFFSKKSNPLLRIIFAGFVWILIEYMQSFTAVGFPWLSLTPALAQWLPFIAPISIFGSYFYTGIMLISFLSLYEFCLHKSKSAGIFCIIYTFLLCIFIYGIYIIPEPLTGLPFKIAVIQGNIEQPEKWLEDSREKILSKYINITKQAVVEAKESNISFDLVVWPETALPFFLSSKSHLTKELTNFVAENTFSLLVGTIRYGGKSSHQKQLLYNSALLYSPNTSLSSWYDKEQLVPFGEYTPFFLETFLNMAKIQNVGQLTPGYDNNLLLVKNIPFGVLICYEILFPSYAQKQVKEGANFLVNISNDAWFGYTRAAWQHLQHAKLRAVEQSRYLVRGTNTGFSAIISPKGRVLEKTQLFTDAILVYVIETQTHRTIYSYLAPYLFFVSLFVVLLIYFLDNIKISQSSTKKIIRRKI